MDNDPVKHQKAVSIKIAQFVITTILFLFIIFGFSHMAGGFHQDCTSTSSNVNGVYQSHYECH